MKLTRLSLAALVAMGAMTCANAKTSLEEAIKGTTISGYVYGQMTSQFGDDIHGNVFRTRAWANVNTGSVGGFSVGMTGYASLGGGKNSNNTSFLEASGTAGKPMPIGKQMGNQRRQAQEVLPANAIRNGNLRKAQSLLEKFIFG